MSFLRRLFGETSLARLERRLDEGLYDANDYRLIDELKIKAINYRAGDVSFEQLQKAHSELIDEILYFDGLNRKIESAIYEVEREGEIPFDLKLKIDEYDLDYEDKRLEINEVGALYRSLGI